MTSITEPLHDHHKFCDDLFADAEDSAQRNDWNKCSDAFERFRNELEAHFATEENDLFPAFERTTGMTGGPTHVMRIEHAQMRDLMAQMSGALEARDTDTFLGAAETLLVLMQQHNMKEENILYPMCDRTLGAVTLDLAGRLRERRREAWPAAA